MSNPGAVDVPKTPWPRAVAFYWAWVWRALVILGPFVALYSVLRLAVSPLFLPVIAGIGILVCGIALRGAASASFRGWTLRLSAANASTLRVVTLGSAFRHRTT